jgi:hypothetical protein
MTDEKQTEAAQEIPFTCCGVDWHRSKVALSDGSYQYVGACLKCGKLRTATEGQQGMSEDERMIVQLVMSWCGPARRYIDGDFAKWVTGDQNRGRELLAKARELLVPDRDKLRDALAEERRVAVATGVERDRLSAENERLAAAVAEARLRYRQEQAAPTNLGRLQTWSPCGPAEMEVDPNGAWLSMVDAEYASARDLAKATRSAKQTGRREALTEAEYRYHFVFGRGTSWQYSYDAFAEWLDKQREACGPGARTLCPTCANPKGEPHGKVSMQPGEQPRVCADPFHACVPGCEVVKNFDGEVEIHSNNGPVWDADKVAGANAEAKRVPFDEQAAELGVGEGLPEVAGMQLDGTLGDFVRACRVFIDAEQATPSPDSGLIGVLCNSIRLAREFVAMAIEPSLPALPGELRDFSQRAAKPATALSGEKPIKVDGKTYFVALNHEASVDKLGYEMTWGRLVSEVMSAWLALSSGMPETEQVSSMGELLATMARWPDHATSIEPLTWEDREPLVQAWLERHPGAIEKDPVWALNNLAIEVANAMLAKVKSMQLAIEPLTSAEINGLHLRWCTQAADGAIQFAEMVAAAQRAKTCPAKLPTVEELGAVIFSVLLNEARFTAGAELNIARAVLAHLGAQTEMKGTK